MSDYTDDDPDAVPAAIANLHVEEDDDDDHDADDDEDEDDERYIQVLLPM